jgi:hypothetical protein
MKKILLFSLFPILSFSQTQIGSNINGEAASDKFGSSIAISSDGSIVAVGAPSNDGSGTTAGPKGSVRVYNNIAGVWTQIGSEINGEAAGDQSGSSVSLSSDGSVLAIGAPYNDGVYGNGSNTYYSGHVRVYRNVSGVWTRIGSDINGESTIDVNGWSVSLSSDGNVLATGAPGNVNSNGANAGHVRIYRNIGDVWTQVGADIDGLAQYDRSGYSVSLSGDGNIVAIGAPHINNQVITSGYVRIFQNIAGVWTQIGTNILGEGTYGISGNSVSLSTDGSAVAIGDYRNSGNGTEAGHVRVYRNISGVWTQLGADIDGEAANNQSGTSVSLSNDGNIVAIGAPQNNNANGSQSGQVRVYQNIAGVWIQIGVDIDGVSINNHNGESVSLSSNGSILAIGAPVNAGNSGSGIARVFNLSPVLSSNHFVQSNFVIYPNPSSDILTIQLNEGLQLEKVNIYNQLGQLVKTENDNVIDTSKFSIGSYYLEVVTNKGKATKIILKE